MYNNGKPSGIRNPVPRFGNTLIGFGNHVPGFGNPVQ
jgi:hypothetical protein